MPTVATIDYRAVRSSRLTPKPFEFSIFDQQIHSKFAPERAFRYFIACFSAIILLFSSVIDLTVVRA